MQFQDIKNGRFYLGDCLEVMKEIPDGVIDLTVTSPPYDDLRTYNGYSFDFENIAKELYRICSEGGVVVWNVNDGTDKNGSKTGTSFKQALYFKEIGFNLHDTMIWDKTYAFSGAKNRYAGCFEFVFILSKGKPKTFNPIKDRANRSSGRSLAGSSNRQKDGSTKKIANQEKAIREFGARYNVWQMFPENSNLERTGHPAQFPIAFARDHIESWSNEGDLVFDPFGGSGTTACAAIEKNRKWVICELSEEYANLAVIRILKREEKPAREVRIDSNIPIPEGEEDGN